MHCMTGTEGMQGSSILVIEDEAHIRKFLRISLEAHGFPVQEARLGEQGIARCAEAPPDLVILDLGLPDLDGQSVIQRIREWSEVPIIVLSVRSDEREKVAALDAGANDYVTKPFGIAELMARIRAALRLRSSALSEDAIFRLGELELDRAMRRVRVGAEEIHLSPKEYDLLSLFATNPGRVLTHRAILRKIWGPVRENESETHHLRVLVGHLRRKLGDNPSRPRYIQTVSGVGYRLNVGE